MDEEKMARVVRLIADLYNDYDTALDWGDRKMAADIKAAIELFESLVSSQ